MIDIQLVAELKNGNPVACKEIFRLLFPRLKNYCRLFIADNSVIEDIIQDAFLKLWEKRKNLRPGQSIESLVFVMTRNRCLNHLKKCKIERNIFDIETQPYIELQYLYQLDFTSLEDKSLEEMLIASLQKAIDELPDRMRDVFIKCKVEGRKQSDVADELGISIKMVEKHISTAKSRLHQKLINLYPSLAVLIALLLK